MEKVFSEGTYESNEIFLLASRKFTVNHTVLVESSPGS